MKFVTGARTRDPERFTRALGVPALIAIGLSAVGASVFYALGIVADKALGLTPFAYLLAGVLFVLTVMTYVEGNALHPERGGASTFARYAGNELWSFIAGWVVILDYLIVMAICVLAAAHYLAPFWSGAPTPTGEILVAVAVIGFVAWANIRGISADRLRRVLRAGILTIALFAVIVVYGFATLWDPAAIAVSVDFGSSPTVPDFVFAIVIAAIALIGIESASGLAGEIRVGGAALRRVVALSAAIVPAVMIGISIVALMALPVRNGATELGGAFAANPVMGVVSVFEPPWVGAIFTAAVGAVAVAVLVLAANGNMLGLSRLGYSLATNRQIPSAIGRLHPGRATPYVLVTIASVLVFALAVSSDLEFLAGLFAFGSMLAATIAHISVIVLRYREPGARRAFRVPLSLQLGKGSIPLPAAIGALAAAAAWISVLVLHEGARLAGGAWMVFGLLLYVTYRLSAGKSVFRRFVIPEQSLRDERDLEYGSILVPVFGHPIDDDIVGTAGRLAAEEAEPGEEVTIDAIFVIEIPMSLPIDARIPTDRVERARAALRRAREVGEEYDGVKVEAATVRGRTVGRAIVSEARRRGVELIVMAAENTGRTRGGVLLGGQADPRDRAFGQVTRYVVEKAPCRVLLTAAPAGEIGARDAVAPS